MEVKQSEKQDINKACPLKLVEVGYSPETSVIEEQILSSYIYADKSLAPKNSYEDTNKVADNNFSKVLLREQENSLKKSERNCVDKTTFCRPVTYAHLLKKYRNDTRKWENLSKLETKEKDQQVLWEKYINKLRIKHEEFLKLQSDSKALSDNIIQESVATSEGYTSGRVCSNTKQNDFPSGNHDKIRLKINMSTNIRYADILGVDKKLSSILSMKDHSAGHSDEHIDNVSASNENIKTKTLDVKFRPYLNIPYKISNFEKECYPISSAAVKPLTSQRGNRLRRETHPVSPDPIPYSRTYPKRKNEDFNQIATNLLKFSNDTDTQTTNDTDTQTKKAIGVATTTQTSNEQITECKCQASSGNLSHIETKLDELISILSDVVDDKNVKDLSSNGSKKSTRIDDEYYQNGEMNNVSLNYSTKMYGSKKSISGDDEHRQCERMDNSRSKYTTKICGSKKSTGGDDEYKQCERMDDSRSKYTTKICGSKKSTGVDDEYQQCERMDDSRSKRLVGSKSPIKKSDADFENSQCCPCPNDNSRITWDFNPTNLIKRISSYNASKFICFNDSEINKNVIPFVRNNDNTSMIGDILKEENDKSDKAKQDIDEILNISRSSFYSVENFELPTKERSEIIFAARQDINSFTEVKTTNIECKNECPDYPVSTKKSESRVLIAVNTDVFKMVNFVKFSSTMINRLLYAINIGCALFTIKSPIHKRSTSRISRSIYLKSKRNVANTATSVYRKPTFKPLRCFKCEYCGKSFTRSYCRELHELDCARSKGLTHDVPEGLICLR